MGATSSLVGVTAHNNVVPLLVDMPTGVVFSAPTEAAQLVGRTIDSAAVRRILASHTTTSLRGPDGTTRITAADPVKGTSWAVVGGISSHTALALARRDLTRNLTVGALTVLLLAALFVILHRRITRPLRRLQRAMEHVTADSVDTRAPLRGPSEIVELAGTYNAMLDARVQSEARFRALAKYDSDFVTVVDTDGFITYANPRAVHAFGISRDADSRTQFLSLVAADDRNHVERMMHDWRGEAADVDSTAEFRLVTKSDENRFVEANVQNLLDDPAVDGLIITCGDITDRKAAEARLTHAALHDALTGLPNRPLVMDRLGHVLQRSRRDGTLSAVLFLDLDSFKLINDTAGHGVGDELLMQVAERLSTVIRPGDTLGRFGGDEFVIICDGMAKVDDAVAVAQRAIDTRDVPYFINGQAIYISSSVGVALARPEDDAQGLLRDADVAMYRAKAMGRGSVCIFDDEMRVETHNRLDIENALLHALDRRELSLCYQPLVAVDDRRAVAVEALLRWTTSDGVSIPPDQFIPVAEETGLIVRIGTWVLEESCRQLTQWTGDGDVPAELAVAVNVSARQLIQPGFPDLVGDILDRYDLPADRLVIEITESTVMRDAVGSIAILTELRDLGVRISVDDFGTGYSSLGYLQRLPIDELKVDRAFVSPLATGPRAASIVQSIVSLGHALGLTVIAEGVETEEQQVRLQRIGCDVSQGFLFSRPVPACEIPGWMRANSTDHGAIATVG
jgi:diguanylate cyclase (GGDEF)-like protein/PAS domain S-box-containing protein